jgi:hypothetical protein
MDEWYGALMEWYQQAKTEVQAAAIECDDSQIAVLMNWVEYEEQKIREYQQ